MYSLHVAQNLREFRDAFEIRHKAYSSASLLSRSEGPVFFDEYDALPNSRTFVLYKKSVAVASTRTFHVGKASETSPILETWGPEIKSFLGESNSAFVEANRLVVDPKRDDPSHGIFTRIVKAHFLRTRAENARFFMAAVREEHVSFYEKTFKMEPITGYKAFPGLNVKMRVLAFDCTALWDSIISRNAFWGISKSDIYSYANQKPIYL